jgi:hypothetical protein
LNIHINLPHDEFGPLNRSSNHLVSPWTPLRAAEQIVGSIQIAGHEDSSDDDHNSLAALVHQGILALFVFHSPANRS